MCYHMPTPAIDSYTLFSLDYELSRRIIL
ncbi:hypothetical protein TNIN_450021, partial [Trichonephila inaurata madagascariensis]